MRKMITAFTGVRFFWAITIVICHIYLAYQQEWKEVGIYANFLPHGGWGVSSFFVLSGFLMCMHYGDKYKEHHTNVFKEGLVFLKSHVKKWYLLYIICMIPMLGILVLKLLMAWDLQKFGLLMGQVAANIFLVQSWIPEQEYSINAVSWYLSCTCAIYLISPLLLRINAKIKENKVCNVIGILIGLAAVFLIADVYGILYCHPFYRIIQYAIGMMLYNLIHNIQQLPLPEKGCCLGAILLNLAAYFVVIPSMLSLMDTLAVIIFILVFYVSESKMLFTNRWIMLGGKKSLEIFLMHYPIVVIGSTVFKMIFPHTVMFYVIESILLLLCVFAAIYIYDKILVKVKEKRHE